MSHTIPRTPRKRRLAVVDGATAAARTASDQTSEALRLAVDNATCPVRPTLSHAAAMCVDSAELFAYSLDGEDLAADDGKRASYLLGLSEAHLVSLVAIIRGLAS
jgi:hypothetical protein